MFPSFRRRLSVVAPVVLLFIISLVGIQVTPSGSQTMKSVRSQTVNAPCLSAFNPSVRTHNPACGSAFNTSVRITATNTGFWFHWWGRGFTYLAGQGPCGKACGNESYMIEGDSWMSNFFETGGVYWNNSTSHSKFVPLKKPGDYQGSACLSNPASGAGACFKFQLVFPQVGTSNLAITSTSLPVAKVGVKYLARLYAHGGNPPYRWIPLYGPPPDLTLIRTGPKAGIITGELRLREPGDILLPVIVRDRMGHSAYEVIVLNQDS